MSRTVEAAPRTSRLALLHPWSGGLILGLDWLLFSGNVLTMGASTVLMVLAGFLGAGIGVTLCQRYAANDGWLKSLVKGVVAGAVVGVPFPIFGTFVGGVVLAVSGLDYLAKPTQPPGPDTTRPDAPCSVSPVLGMPP